MKHKPDKFENAIIALFRLPKQYDSQVSAILFCLANDIKLKSD